VRKSSAPGLRSRGVLPYRARRASATAGRVLAARRRESPLTEREVLELQALAGNQAVSRLVVARQPAANPAAPATTTPAQPAIAWIDDLDPHVQEQIDTFSEAFLQKQSQATQKALHDQRTANRATFMNTMRTLFGSDAATEAHFREIKPMANDPTYPVWAHVSTRERLLEVQQDLQTQKTPMPQTDVALGLRGDHLHPQGKSAGWFTHATGFALDWKAHAAPHIMDTRLITLFETVTGGTPHFDLKLGPQQRLDMIEKMGQGKATAEESKAFLDRLESEYNRLVANSQTFKTDLPETSLEPLRRVEAARDGVTSARGKLARLQRSGAKKVDVAAAKDELAAAITAFDATKAEVTAQLPKIFEPWTKLLDARIQVIDKLAADKGVDLGKLTGKYGFDELRKKLASLQQKRGTLERAAKTLLAEVMQIQRDTVAVLAKVEAAKAWLSAPGKAPAPDGADDLIAQLDGIATTAEAVGTSLEPLKAALGSVLPGAVVEPKRPAPLPAMAVSKAAVANLRAAVDKLPSRVTASAGKLDKVVKPLADLVAQVTGAQADIKLRTDYRAQKVEELGGGTDRASRAKGEAEVTALLEQKVKWLALRGAKEALQTDAEGFVFKAADVRNPAITQLLGMMSGTRGGGFFTPDPETGGEAEAKAGKWSDTHGFNLAFMKSMVSHGFELGVAWQGMSDTMHFELVEGRRLLESGGSRALVAGATLRASEAAPAAAGSP
jgi:hypothetical protein